MTGSDIHMATYAVAILGLVFMPSGWSALIYALLASSLSDVSAWSLYTGLFLISQLGGMLLKRIGR